MFDWSTGAIFLPPVAHAILFPDLWPFRCRFPGQPQMPAVEFLSWDNDIRWFLDHLSQLQNLECLMLHGFAYGPPRLGPITWSRFSYIQSLRELYIDRLDFWKLWDWVPPQIELPLLEVLFLNNVALMGIPFHNVLDSHPKLRILVITGDCVTFPDWVSSSFDNTAASEDNNADESEIWPFHVLPRGAVPNGAKVLHVFLGKTAAKCLSFMRSLSDISAIHPINEPMPQFLERDDIAEIFRGVWLAEKIKEAAKYGVKFWNYEEDTIDCIL